MPATTDRGDIVHLAGRHHLSPALRDGAPALLAGPDPAATRCGWEPFFRALSERGAAVAFAPDDAGSVRVVPRAEARRDPAHRASLARSLDTSRRFVAALGGRGAKAG